MFKEKLMKLLTVTKNIKCSIVIIVAQNEEEIKLEENPNKGPPREPP
jgi:hypothetical protein